MKKFYKTECLTQLRQNSDLGINNKTEWMPCVFDLDEVCGFMYDEDDDNNPITQVKFKNGEAFSINVELEDFQKVITDALAIKMQ